MGWASIKDVPAKERAAKVERALAACALLEVRNRVIGRLSKGFRQRVGLAQAIVHDPAVLVLDEPTAGLDPLMQREFHALVRETVETGRTVFLSSHQLDEVQHVADRVGIIRDGRLVAVEPVDQPLRAIRRQRDSEHADDAALGWYERLRQRHGHQLATAPPAPGELPRARVIGDRAPVPRSRPR